MRHKWADLIHLWAEGDEIQHTHILSQDDIGWIDSKVNPMWDSEFLQFRVKPKEPEWHENIPEHGVLCWVSDMEKSHESVIDLIIKFVGDSSYKFRGINSAWFFAKPLTNKEIEEFKR